MRDKLLLESLKNDDEIALKELFETYFVPLTRYVNHYIGDPSCSEEIALDIFLYIWEHRSDLNITSSFKSYIFIAARNRSYNFLRRLRRTEPIDRPGREFPDFSDQQQHEIGGMDLLIREAVLSLPPKCMEVFRLSRQEGLSNRQIALRLEITVKAVEAHITKALKIIRSHLNRNTHFLF